MTPIIELQNLTKRYEDFSLRDITLEIPEGGITGIFGPSGAGKTTLIKLLANQIPRSSGDVRIFGLSFEEREKEIKNRIGYVAQEPHYYWSKTVRWTARFVSRFYERWDGAGFYRLIDEFKISPYKRLKNLSRGQKTLVSLAIAFSHEADLYLLDEPASGLDMVLREHPHPAAGAGRGHGQDRDHLLPSHRRPGRYRGDDLLPRWRHSHHARDKEDLLADWKWLHWKNGSLAPDVTDRLIDVEKQPFGSRGLTKEFPAIRERLEQGISSGDVKTANAKLDDILIAMLEGE